MMVKREVVGRARHTPLLCSYHTKLLKQYLGFLVPCTPWKVANNPRFCWFASVESKQRACVRRTLGEREPASCHLEILLLGIQNTDRNKSAQAFSHQHCHFMT